MMNEIVNAPTVIPNGMILSHSSSQLVAVLADVHLTHHGMPRCPRWFCTTTKLANTPTNTPPVTSIIIIHKFSCQSGQ